MFLLFCRMSPLPRWHRLRISPQTFLGISRFRLQSLKVHVSYCILPIPPAPAIRDQRMVDGSCHPVEARRAILHPYFLWPHRN